MRQRFKSISGKCGNVLCSPFNGRKNVLNSIDWAICWILEKRNEKEYYLTRCKATNEETPYDRAAAMISVQFFKTSSHNANYFRNNFVSIWALKNLSLRNIASWWKISQKWFNTAVSYLYWTNLWVGLYARNRNPAMNPHFMIGILSLYR